MLCSGFRSGRSMFMGSVLLLLWFSCSCLSANAQLCSVATTLNPSAPVAGQQITFTANVQNVPPVDNDSATVNLDGAFLCSTPGQQGLSCSATVAGLTAGTHTLNWSCTESGSGGNGSNSGSQNFTVSPSPTPTPTPTATPTPTPPPTGPGTVNPKFIVLSVIYAPPGQNSSVDYGSSTLVGGSTTFDHSFADQKSLSMQLQLGPDIKGPNLTAAGTHTFTQTQDSNQTITLNKTTTFDTQVPGPTNSGDGINHDFDVILLWINPVLNLNVTSTSSTASAVWTGYSFDAADPANEVDIVPVYVGWLKNPSTIPPGVAAALARTWAAASADGSGPGLDANDFATILARDPFANGATTIDPTRFDLTGQTFSYAPPVNGGQPLTQKFVLQYQSTSTQGKTATDEYKITHSVQFNAAIAGFFKAQLKDQTTLTWDSSAAQTSTNASGQTATLTLTDPSSAYNGPTDLQVYQDNVYGTFMFAFTPEQPVQNIWATPPDQTVPLGGTATYQVGLSALTDFTGNVSLSASVAPAGCGTASFSPASITGAATSTLSLSCSTAGTYSITITGTGGTTHTTTVNLTVSPALFVLTALPASQAITPGGSTTYTVMTQPTTGFNGSVALSAPSPTGCGTITFNPPTVSGAALSTMTVPTCSTPGQYSITISGTSSGSPTATTTVGLTVAAPPTPGSGCTIATTLSPASPVVGDTVSFSASIQQPVPALNYGGSSVNVDGQALCTVSSGSTSCQGALASLSTGSHAINWSCTGTGGAQAASGSGTQLFSVALAPGTANLRPKFIVLSVMYAPPGQASNVDYGTSTLLGTSSSFKNIFADSSTKTITTGAGITIGPFSAGRTVSNSQSFTQTGETNNSLTVNKTQTSDIKVPGPKSSADGIDHTFDVILVWINPIVNFTITGPNTANITGYSFDPADPANEMDVVPLYVGWLQNPSTIPPGVKQVLARSWAGPPVDGSGPGLTNADFAQILARDPFTNANYVPTLNPGATTTTDGRFDLVDGETLSYAPPVSGDQPLQQKFNLQYQNTSQGGLTSTDSYEVAYEQQITLKGSVDVATFFKVNFSQQVTTSKDLTWTNQATQTSTTTNTRTASLVLTSPSSTYNGPTDLQLFQDNVYGTFMFAFSPNTPSADFGLLASPDGEDILAGGTVSSQLSLLPLNGFTGAVSLTGSISPASGCGAVTFSPATISGTAKSTATVTCTTAGNYTLTITGTSGTASHTATVAITVFPAPTFIFFGTPSQGAVIPGASGATTTTFTLSTSAVSGFNGTIWFSVSGLPPGATSSFNPATVTGTGSTVLTIGASQPGTYPLTITATSGSLVQTIGATLVVAPAPVQNGCTAQINISPAAASFDTPVTISVTPGGPPGIALTVTGSLDNKGSFCSATNTGCSATFNNLSSGIHAATWSCSGQGVPSGSNTQLFAVGPTGAFNPKYLVLSVMYAPPGQSSTVDYGASKMLGTATSITDTFQHQTVFTSTLNLGLDYSIRQHKKNHEGDSFSVSDQRTETQTFTESLQGTSSITINKTQNSDQIVPGPKSTTTEGIDHDFDVVLLWLNPVIEFTITGPSTATIAGYSFDENDPVGEMDVVPVYVAWLKDPTQMPPGVRFALARLWADQPLDGSGTALTSVDFQAILARDPFANGPVPIDTNRFVLSGETFAYAPAPNGGQPFTEKSTLAYQTTNQQSVTVTDKYAVSFSTKSSDSGSAQGFFNANLAQTGGIGGGSTQTLTITNSNGLQTTQSAGQSATLSLVGPSSAYTGPDDLQVYQDTVYGTFLFAFVPETNFQLFVASPSQVVAPGASASYSISTGVISNFSGTIAFSANGLPAGAAPAFNPATLSGAGSTTLSVSVPSSLAPGVYGFTIVGSVSNGGATETHAVNATLVVSPAANFTLSMSPAASEAIIGSNASYTITVSSNGGFTGNVTLTASNLAPGATATFNPASISGTGSSTLTITPASTTPPGNYFFTVTGTSGLLTQSALADLAVAAAPTQTVSGTPCAVNIAISPSTPLANQTTTFQATITQVPPANNWNLSVTLDGQSLCGPTTSSCSSTQNSLALGPHTLGWSCTDSGTAGSGSGSGTQPFTVAPPSLPSGSVNPKFLVLSVIYTPPGSKSTVDYGTSTAVGTTTSINNSFASSNTKANVTLTNTIPVPPANPNEQLGSVGGTASGSTSGTFTETVATASSVAINKTTSFDIQVPGLSNPTDGIDHDYDIIMVWLNPVLNLQIVDSATAQIPGYSFDPADPAAEVDVVPLYVKWLKNPLTMPPGIANALARVWAAPPADGSGPGLTTADLQAILARDPFTDPSYQLTVNPGATTSTDGRFDIQAGETFAYEPPPFGGQPLTDKFSIQYQQTSTTGQSKTDQYQTSFSLTGQSNIKGWLSGNLQTATMMTWTNQFALKTTNVSTQTASLSLVGPCFGYTGPTDVQVFQDNVYGTFLFAFANNPQSPDFSVCVTSNPNPLTVNTGASGTYTVSSSPSNGFTGTVSLSASGLPTGFTATFNPPSVTGSATSTLTVTVPPSAAAGTYTFTVTGTSGTLSHSTPVLLVVNAAPAFSVAVGPASQSANLGANANFTISTAAFNGFTGSVGLSASVSPASGCSVPVLSPTSISGTQTATLTLSCSVGGSYSITITGTSGSGSNQLVQTVQATLNATDFALAGSPGSQSVACGSTTYTISTTALNGFAGSVALSASVSGSPAGVTTGFSPASITGAGSSTLTVTTTAATPAGSYTITVTGTSSNLVHTTTLTLQITDFGVSAGPSSQTVTAGAATTFSFSTTAINGFNSSVALSVSGLPANTTATFSPASIAGAGSSTLTVSTSSGTPAGSLSLTLTGASGCRSHSATVTLAVNPASTPGTASVTIGGSTDRSTQILTQAATPASVTVTLGGSDSTNFSVVCVLGRCHTNSIKDSGTISFTVVVSGVTVGPVSASYNGSSTLAGLATTLFNNFPANSVVTMSNPNGGISFTLTTVATGSSANSSTISTSMVSSCVDSDTLTCTGVGWTMTLSGPNLAPTNASSANFTGGTDNVLTTVFDTGSISLSVIANGTTFTKTSNYGQNSSPAGIALDLSNQINADAAMKQVVTAAVSGNVLNLTTVATGPGTGYPLTVSSATNSNNFASGSTSFPATPSGSTFTPGH